MLAMATCPTTTCVPSEYCASNSPPLARPRDAPHARRRVEVPVGGNIAGPVGQAGDGETDRGGGVRRRQLAVGAEGERSGSAGNLRWRAGGAAAYVLPRNGHGVRPRIGAGLLKIHRQSVAGAQRVVDLDGLRVS